LHSALSQSSLFSGVPEFQVKRMAFPDTLAAYPLIELIEILCSMKWRENASDSEKEWLDKRCH